MPRESTGEQKLNTREKRETDKHIEEDIKTKAQKETILNGKMEIRNNQDNEANKIMEKKESNENEDEGEDDSDSDDSSSDSDSGSDSDSRSESGHDNSSQGEKNKHGEECSNNNKNINKDDNTNVKTQTIESNNEAVDKNNVHIKIHKMYDKDEEISRKNSASSSYEKDAAKKKKNKILGKLKIQSYFHKSYDKVSNVIMKTSRSILKTGQTGDNKSDKREHPNDEILGSLNSIDKFHENTESQLSEEDLNNLENYLDNKINIIESNEEIVKNFNSYIEKHDSKKMLNELNELLNERKLLITAVNHFKKLSTDYKNTLEKYKDSYFILKDQNEQLTENVKTLKYCISSIQSNEENNNKAFVDNNVNKAKMSLDHSEVKG